MTNIGSRAANKTIYVKQGTDWTATFWFTNPDGSVVDLTGSSFGGQIRRSRLSSDIAATFTFSVNLSTNKVTASLSGVITSAMVAGEKEIDEDSKYVYDWEWTKSDTTIDRFQEGALILSAEVTR